MTSIVTIMSDEESTNVNNISYVYLFPMKDLSCFKIGKSNEPEKRFRELVTYYELDLSTSKVFECQSERIALTVENILHKTFDAFRTILPHQGGTEFFNYHILDDVIKLIDIISKGYNINQFSLRADEMLNPPSMGESTLLLIKIGNSIKRKRLSLGLTQDDIAELLEVSRRSIFNLEKGNNCTSELMVSTLLALGMEDLFDNLYIDSTNLNSRAKRWSFPQH